MLSRIFWGTIIGTLAAFVYVGYKRGAFERDNVRYGYDRVREGLQKAGNRARESLHMARNRMSEGMQMAGNAASEAASETQHRSEESSM